MSFAVFVDGESFGKLHDQVWEPVIRTPAIQEVADVGDRGPPAPGVRCGTGATFLHCPSPEVTSLMATIFLYS
jgi:hypothetical protein